MKIMGFYKSTMLDYPDHLASAVFTRQCNFRCPYCHNGDLVLETSDKWDIEEEKVLEHLKKRKNLLEGLVISGGEPTLSKRLIPFIKKVKALGLKVKLDTNGSNPKILEELIQTEQLDYIAMDIKNTYAKYAETVGLKHIEVTPIQESIAQIINSDVPHEFRTTLIKEFHEPADIMTVAKLIDGADAFYLQQYEATDKLLGEGPFNFYTVEEMKGFKKDIEQYHYVSKIEVRGRF